MVGERRRGNQDVVRTRARLAAGATQRSCDTTKGPRCLCIEWERFEVGFGLLQMRLASRAFGFEGGRRKRPSVQRTQLSHRVTVARDRQRFASRDSSKNPPAVVPQFSDRHFAHAPSVSPVIHAIEG
jgi:hypothetical protein